MIYNDEELDKKIDQLDILLASTDDLGSEEIAQLSSDIYDYETVHIPMGEPIFIENAEQFEIARRAVEYPNILKLDPEHIENLLNALDTYEMTHLDLRSSLE